MHRGPRGAKSPPVRVRPARASDLETLAQHRNRMWADIGSYSARQIRAGSAASRRWIGREFRAGRYIAFVAERKGTGIVGSGAVWLRPSQPYPGPRPRPETPYILSMYTRPDARGTGIATRLVRQMIRWARRKKYRRITLHASAQGASVYRALGFEASNEMRLSLVRGGTRGAAVARRRPPHGPRR